MSLTHAILNGRFFGGDVQNQQIVSGAFINAPPSVPEPTSIFLLLTGLTLANFLRRQRGRRNG